MKKDHLVLIFWGIIIFAGGLWMGNSYTNKKYISKPDNLAVQAPDQYQLIGNCTGEQCLFKEPNGTGIGGYGKIKGYYYSYTKDFYGEEGSYNGNHTCDAFIVTSVDSPIATDFVGLIKNGNTVQSLTSTGNLILNLSIPFELRSLIINSTFNQPVELSVIRKTGLWGRATRPCESLVDIVSVR